MRFRKTILQFSSSLKYATPLAKREDGLLKSGWVQAYGSLTEKIGSEPALTLHAIEAREIGCYLVEIKRIAHQRTN